MRRVVIVGGGWWGLRLCQRLAALLAPRREVEVVLVEEGEAFCAAPFSPWWLTETPRRHHQLFDYHQVVPSSVRWVQASACGADLATGRLALRGAEALAFDALVLCVGDVAAPLPLADAALGPTAYAAGCLHRSRASLAALEAGDRLVVVGAGSLGVEVASALSAFRHGSGGGWALTLVEKEPEILPCARLGMRRSAREVLEMGEVEILNKVEIVGAEVGALLSASGARLGAKGVVWCHGRVGARWMRDLGCVLDAAGRLWVDADGRVQGGHGDVYAVGVCASLLGEGPLDMGSSAAQVEVVARNIEAGLTGRARRSLRGSAMGRGVLLAGRRAVLPLGESSVLEGRLAWLMAAGMRVRSAPLAELVMSMGLALGKEALRGAQRWLAGPGRARDWVGEQP